MSGGSVEDRLPMVYGMFVVSARDVAVLETMAFGTAAVDTEAVAVRTLRESEQLAAHMLAAVVESSRSDSEQYLGSVAAKE